MEKLFQKVDEMLALLVHNGKNHLGPIKGYASLIQDDNEIDTNTRRWADKIERNARRMEDYFELLNSYGIRSAVGIREISWPRLVARVMNRFAAVNIKGIPIEIVNYTRGTFAQHGELLTRVLTHLVINGYESIESTGKLALTVEEAGKWDQGKRRFVIRVSDTGCGIERKYTKLIWEPFFSTKHHHVGLGLPYVAAAAPILGMEVDVESRPGHGTTVGLVLSEQGG